MELLSALGELLELQNPVLPETWQVHFMVPAVKFFAISDEAECASNRLQGSDARARQAWYPVDRTELETAGKTWMIDNSARLSRCGTGLANVLHQAGSDRRQEDGRYT
jgi:hypothetical protein